LAVTLNPMKLPAGIDVVVHPEGAACPLIAAAVLGLVPVPTIDVLEPKDA